MVMVKTNEVKRSYYLNLFSGNAEITKNDANSKNTFFKWNIRDLLLGSYAEIALVQIVQTNATATTGYAIRCLETYADGYDSYNQTSAILYLGLGLTTPQIPTYHKLIASNLNKITLVLTDDLSASSNVYSGISTGISFSVIFHIIDYVDAQNSY